MPHEAPRGAWVLALLLIVAAALWLQRAALWAPFFADDYLFLDQVRDRSLAAVLAAPDPIGNFARPVGRQLAFWVLERLGSGSPAAFHAFTLALFAASLALLFAIARRVAGTRAAVVASAFLALHYAADVPLLWASGTQDLIALTGALGAIALFLAGRRAWAALALLAALLSKETVLFTPLIAALAARRPAERGSAALARAWPLGAAVVAWAALWIAAAAHGPARAHPLSFSLGAMPAAFAHLFQVALGLEWRAGAGARILTSVPPLVPLALALAGVALAGARQRRAISRGTAAAATGARGLGLAWALLGAVPVMAVAPIWSAYYYLFALCGLAILIGASLSRAPRWVALLAVALLAWGSHNARTLDEFITAPGVWTRESHVNRFYVERATGRVQSYLFGLKRLHPALPPRSTLFFAGLPAFIGFQTADGPLVRWAYRDSSLRSYYLKDFSLARYRRGPAFFFNVDADTLGERTGRPDLMRNLALHALLQEKPEMALEALTVAREQDPSYRPIHYWAAWAAWSLGRRDSARAELQAAGVALDASPAPEIPTALRLVAAGDTAGATRVMTRAVWRHPFDPGAHALLSDLLQRDPGSLASAAMECYAARLLAPRHARNWWRWGFIQARLGRFEQAVPSLERFLALGGDDPRDVADARVLLAQLRQTLPGGELAQEGLRSRSAGGSGRR
ncbi:MAG: hypothetical protein HZC42_07065 [Candidatus Eisenbacteria bacterium]|nr:hypothetical protein [Candidatus Eisenbacteria bacterium]